MWILRVLGPIKFCKGPIKISNGPLKFGNCIYLNGIWAIGPFKGPSSFWARINPDISHKITFGAPSSGGVLCSPCGAFISFSKNSFRNTIIVSKCLGLDLILFQTVCKGYQQSKTVSNGLDPDQDRLSRS